VFLADTCRVSIHPRPSPFPFSFLLSSYIVVDAAAPSSWLPLYYLCRWSPATLTTSPQQVWFAECLRPMQLPSVPCQIKIIDGLQAECRLLDPALLDQACRVLVMGTVIFVDCCRRRDCSSIRPILSRQYEAPGSIAVLDPRAVVSS